MRVVCFLALVGAAAAACPNLCSGHGTCSQNDICTCYANWQGPDCSLRTCPFGNSWALDAADPHTYEECSGAGLCDRATGQCNCFEGYSGYSCQRRACPNDCSGHGVCRTLAEIETDVPYPASAWDADHIQACVCDAGYFGTDCSQRRCPTGDDPLTLCSSTVQGQVQQLTVTLGSKRDSSASPPASSEEMELFGVTGGTTGAVDIDTARRSEALAQLRVGIADASGQVFYAPTAAKAVFAKGADETGYARPDPGAVSLEVALENIANFKVRNVRVSAALTDRAKTGSALGSFLEKRYLVTFVPHEASSANFGVQSPLVCDSGYSCATPGCAPMVRMPFLYRYAAVSAERVSLDDTFVPGGLSFNFYTGVHNTQAAFEDVCADSTTCAGGFIRLAADSMPRLPPGVSVDTGLSASSERRYDIRVVIAVQDPADSDGREDAVDVFFTKVVYSHTNITTDTFEYADGAYAGAWSDAKKDAFAGTLLGFTYRGKIPGTKLATLPDAPGVTLQFPAQNMVFTDGNLRFYEILVKLPACTVTPLLVGTEFVDVDGSAIKPVDANVENVECSSRGQCNRDTGLCECYEGFAGIACSRQSVIV